MGSVWARVTGTGRRPDAGVVGHIDEIGLIVTHVDDDGFLRFTGVGGWDPQILVGQRVSVATREGAVAGVIGRKPIHLLKDEERKKVARMDELHIDIGAKDGDEARGARARRRRRRDRGRARRAAQRPRRRALDGQPPGLLRGLEAARLVAEAGGAPGDVVAVAAVQEETTLRRLDHDRLRAAPRRGARRRRHPRHRRARHRGQRARRAPVRLGPGHRARLEPQPARLRAALRHRRGRGIPFTIQASARYTGTDADAVHVSRGGVPTGCIGLPLRYMHSPVEMVQLEDVASAAELIAASAQRLTAETSFPR